MWVLLQFRCDEPVMGTEKSACLSVCLSEAQLTQKVVYCQVWDLRFNSCMAPRNRHRPNLLTTRHHTNLP